MLVIRRMTTALLAGHLLLLVGVGTTCCSIKTVMFPLLADAFAPQPSRRNAHRQQWRSNQCISQGTDVVDNGVRTCSVLNGFLGGGAQAKIPKTVSER